MREIKESIAKMRGLLYEHQEFMSDIADVITEIENECEEKEKSPYITFQSTASVDDGYYGFQAVRRNGKTHVIITDKIKDDKVVIDDDTELVDMLAGFSEILTFISEEESKKLFTEFLNSIMDKGWI